MNERERRKSNEHTSQATNKKVEGSSGIEMVNGILLFVYNSVIQRQVQDLLRDLRVLQ